MEEKKLWKDVLSLIRLSVSGANFSTWFTQTFITSTRRTEDGRQLVEIGCPSSFAADALERRYFGLIQDSLNQVTGVKNDLSFCVKQLERTKEGDPEAPLFSADSRHNAPSQLEAALKRCRITPGFGFDNFAVSGSNQMAHAAADAVSQNLGGAYNPLFIWGGVGVGKTHLMLAIAQKVLFGFPEEKVFYCTGEEFTTEMVEAIRTKTTQAFKRRYRDLRLLLVDDIQFIAGKIAIQEEFFHTFVAILRGKGQVVLTSDVPPTEIPKLEERLRSRFEAGLIVDIAPPDFELRTAITMIKAKEEGVDISPQAAQTIAANLDTPRRIRGFLARLVSETEHGKKPITDDMVAGVLNKTNGDTRTKKTVHPSEFVLAVSAHFSLGKRRLLGESRAQQAALPRQILMYLLRTEAGLPLQEVGRVVGGRDHTTVMHAVNKISTVLSTNEKIRGDILRIKQNIFG
ncbi:MAG: chromosomal replication initiator protein DnaA [Candidatus Blackburnbacteria bacterium]|nr:chromosomal replication initiator protein DnaA [Candidatus Blackburnbacteria bacterium]